MPTEAAFREGALPRDCGAGHGACAFPLDSLPPDCLVRVTTRCSPRDICALSATCRAGRAFAESGKAWAGHAPHTRHMAPHFPDLASASGPQSLARLRSGVRSADGLYFVWMDRVTGKLTLQLSASKGLNICSQEPGNEARYWISLAYTPGSDFIVWAELSAMLWFGVEGRLAPPFMLPVGDYQLGWKAGKCPTYFEWHGNPAMCTVQQQGGSDSCLEYSAGAPAGAGDGSSVHTDALTDVVVDFGGKGQHKWREREEQPNGRPREDHFDLPRGYDDEQPRGEPREGDDEQQGGRWGGWGMLRGVLAALLRNPVSRVGSMLKGLIGRIGARRIPPEWEDEEDDRRLGVPWWQERLEWEVYEVGRVRVGREEGGESTEKGAGGGIEEGGMGSVDLIVNLGSTETGRRESERRGALLLDSLVLMQL